MQPNEGLRIMVYLTLCRFPRYRLSPAPLRASSESKLAPYKLDSLVARATSSGRSGSKERALPILLDFRSILSIL